MFFTKAVWYQRRNVLNMFSNTMILIYKGLKISVFFFQTTPCTSFSIFLLKSQNIQKKLYQQYILQYMKFKPIKHIKSKISSVVLKRMLISVQKVLKMAFICCQTIQSLLKLNYWDYLIQSLLQIEVLVHFRLFSTHTVRSD